MEVCIDRDNLINIIVCYAMKKNILLKMHVFKHMQHVRV